MNRIVYGNHVFQDKDILSANITLSNAMISESLSADELIFTVWSNDTDEYRYLLTNLEEYYSTSGSDHYRINVGALQNYTYGDTVYYYKDNALKGEFYISNVTRTGKNIFRIECVSAVGLLINIPHVGGVYEGTSYTVGNLIRGIFTTIGYVENTDYSIDTEVDEAVINGWLPYSNCRDNLRQILFAVGASIVKNADNILEIKYISAPETVLLPDDRIYIGGSVDYLTPATSIELTEHEYHALSTDQEVVLYDNTSSGETALNEFVQFNEPCHTLTVSGLTLGSNGANYAVVSGIGTLKGKKYTHTKRILSENILTGGKENVIQVTDATLVSLLNSINVKKRVSKYYGQAKEISYGIVLGDELIRPSTKLSFTDPFGEQTTGYVKSMDITVSEINKADSVIATDWTPSNFGNNITNAVVLSTVGSGTWTSPVTGTVRAVLIGGGQGGQGGYNGGNGSTSSAIVNTNVTILELISYTTTHENSHGAIGLGGNAGAGGNAGKVYTVEFEAVQGTTYSFNIGSGGSGGSANGGIGSNGGNTTITVNGTTYSSASGTIPTNGYINSLTGDVYARQGWEGVKGQDGGIPEWEPAGGTSYYYKRKTENIQFKVTHDSVKTMDLSRGNVGVYNNQSYIRYTINDNYGTAYMLWTSFEACGGGGAFGYYYQNYGGDATGGTGSNSTYYGSVLTAKGGNGADAISIQELSNSSIGYNIGQYNVGIGGGGAGGNGGGGGSPSGNVWKDTTRMANGNYSLTTNLSSGGTGGSGSRGCSGGSGGIVIYY